MFSKPSKLALITALGLALPAAPAFSAEKPAQKQVLRLSNIGEPRELDPTLASGSTESRIVDSLFEGLTSLDPETLAVKPGVAASWTLSPDGKEYTFNLRPEASWSDGTPVTAHDFVFSWARLLDPKTASEYAYIAYPLKNGEAFNKGQLKDPAQLGVKAKDDRTLVVTLEQPTSYFLSLVAFKSYYPTPRHVLAKFNGRPDWAKEGNLVSNGAFKLAEWRLNKHIKLVPNEHYWDRAKVQVTEAYIVPIENLDTTEKAFLSGDIHLTHEVPDLKVPAYQREIAENPGKYHPFKADPYAGTYFFRMNTTKPPLNDKRVRKALSLTLDRNLIVTKAIGAGERAAETQVPQGMPGYQSKTTLNTTVTADHIAEAKRLLAEAGYPDGKGLPKIELLYNTSENHKRIAAAVGQMWKKNLGVDIALVNQEWKVYLNSMNKLEFSVARAGWIADYLDPMTFLDMFTTSSAQNNTGWSNPAFDALIKKAATIQDQASRYATLAEAEALLLDEMPIVPVYHYVSRALVSDKLRLVREDGTLVPYRKNLTDRINLKHVVLAE